MTFVGKIDVPENAVTIQQVASNVVLYVFGAREKVEGGWEMKYEVVEQHYDLS